MVIFNIQSNFQQKTIQEFKNDYLNDIYYSHTWFRLVLLPILNNINDFKSKINNKQREEDNLTENTNEYVDALDKCHEPLIENNNNNNNNNRIIYTDTINCNDNDNDNNIQIL